jgi:hypothetical protein
MISSKWKPSLELLKLAVENQEIADKIKNAGDWYDVLCILRIFERSLKK